MDAALIARFCLAQQPPAWSPPAPQVRELQAVVRRLESLIEMRVAEENRLSSGIAVGAVRHSLETHIAYLVEEIKQTELLIQKHIREAFGNFGAWAGAVLQNRECPPSQGTLLSGNHSSQV